MVLNKKIRSNKPFMYLVGLSVLISGIVLVLSWWPDVVTVFRGTIGILIAVVGMIILAMIRD